ncbi:hypothetical protein E4U41_006032 [Claviceps citrina]|nr:hypothetical protein E4U41_006032 [Claviceps citrina]
MAPRVDVEILRALRLQDQEATIRPHGRSHFASTFKLTTTDRNGQSKSYFVKTGTGEKAESMFRGEHFSLNAIYNVVPQLCPRSHAHGAMSSPNTYFLATDFLDMESTATGGSGLSLAAKLGRLHTTPAPIPEGHDQPMFGFPVPTCCGETPQDNTYKASWADFFAENRLRRVLEACLRKHGADAELSDAVQAVAARVVPRLVGEAGPMGRITPVVVHGDLWSGNCSVAQIAGRGGREEVVFDPAAVYGHSEYELGIMSMFGGRSFGPGFWQAYQRLVPTAEPRGEWEDRRLMYEL